MACSQSASTCFASGSGRACASRSLHYCVLFGPGARVNVGGGGGGGFNRHDALLSGRQRSFAAAANISRPRSSIRRGSGRRFGGRCRIHRRRPSLHESGGDARRRCHPDVCDYWGVRSALWNTKHTGYVYARSTLANEGAFASKIFYTLHVQAPTEVLTTRCSQQYCVDAQCTRIWGFHEHADRKRRNSLWRRAMYMSE